MTAAVNNSYVLQAVDGGLGKDYLPIRYWIKSNFNYI